MFEFRVIYADKGETIKSNSLAEILEKQRNFVKLAKKDKSIWEVTGVRLVG